MSGGPKRREPQNRARNYCWKVKWGILRTGAETRRDFAGCGSRSVQDHPQEGQALFIHETPHRGEVGEWNKN